MDAKSEAIFLAKLAEMGEEQVRFNIARGSFSGVKRQIAEAWVDNCVTQKGEEARLIKEKRAEEHNEQTRKANRIGMIIAISSSIAATASVIAAVVSTLNYLRL